MHAVGGSSLLAYTVYGHGNLATEPCLRFGGQLRELISGYYLLGNGYRAYNPVLMRFNSPDSYSPFGAGGGNCYMYCSGDPVSRSDPTGHMDGVPISISRASKNTSLTTIAEKRKRFHERTKPVDDNTFVLGPSEKRKLFHEKGRRKAVTESGERSSEIIVEKGVEVELAPKVSCSSASMDSDKKSYSSSSPSIDLIAVKSVLVANGPASNSPKNPNNQGSAVRESNNFSPV